jgi:trehalose/maltose hydrolase-like predicted phosphorylase
MFLLSSDFTLEEKRRNFDFYDPLTTRDSSLSKHSHRGGRLRGVDQKRHLIGELLRSRWP